MTTENVVRKVCPELIQNLYELTLVSKIKREMAEAWACLCR